MDTLLNQMAAINQAVSNRKREQEAKDVKDFVALVWRWQKPEPNDGARMLELLKDNEKRFGDTLTNFTETVRKWFWHHDQIEQAKRNCEEWEVRHADALEKLNTVKEEASSPPPGQSPSARVGWNAQMEYEVKEARQAVENAERFLTWAKGEVEGNERALRDIRNNGSHNLLFMYR